MIDHDEFARAYNNINQLPRVGNVAEFLGISERTTRRYAAELKRQRADGNDVPKLIDRGERHRREIITKPVSYEEPIDELIKRVSNYNERYGAHCEQKGLVAIHLNCTKPFGVVGMPDNHLNNIGTNVTRAFEDAQFIAKQPNVFAVGIGDWIDNFIIGKLERERRKDIMSHQDSWRLLEHYIGIIADRLIIALSGNHCDYTSQLGGYDVVKRIFEDHGLTAIYDQNKVRVRLITGTGHEFIHLARHKFRGSSKYNAMHGIASWILEQWQGEDVIWGGHIHVAGHVSIERFWQNQRRVVHGIQLASYKQHDEYAAVNGFRPNVPFLVPIVIHIPENGKTIFFEDMYEGVEYLNYISG